jgi:hypothetical protein
MPSRLRPALDASPPPFLPFHPAFFTQEFSHQLFIPHVSHLQTSGILVYPHKVPHTMQGSFLYVRQTVHTIQHPCDHPLYTIGGSVFSALLQMAVIKQWNASQIRLYFRQGFVYSTKYSSLLSVSFTTNNLSPPTSQKFRPQRPPPKP